MFVPPEFQAVILAAGKGSRMPEITTGKAKCLLPIGSKPLIWYPLYKLQQFGLKDVIIIIQQGRKSEVQEALTNTGLTIKIDYVTVSDTEEMTGTADSLRLLQDKITSDLMVFSCDVITVFDLMDVIDEFRKHDASFCSVLFQTVETDGQKPPGSKKHKPERDLIGIDAKTNRLVFLASASDFEDNLFLSKTLIKKHPNIKMHSNLVDSHIYLMKNWVFKYLCSKTTIATLKGEFLPHLIKKQLLKQTESNKLDENRSGIAKQVVDDVFQLIPNDEKQYVKKTNSYLDHNGDLEPCYHGDSIKCYAYICKKATFGIRVNSLQPYWSIQQKISEIWEKIAPGVDIRARHYSAEVNTNQATNCFIWDLCKLNAKTSFTYTLLGSKTEVKSFTRIINSVIMNDVLIHEKVVLENCIVCDKAVINTGSILKNCIVGSTYEVEENSEHVNEVLTNADKLMEF